jgi:hypothetical protein
MRNPTFAIVVLFLVALPAMAQKEKPRGEPPRAMYALPLAADAGKTSKLTLRGLRLDGATEVRVGDPKSTAKVVGKGRKAPISNQMSAELVGDTEIDVEVTLPADVPGGVVPISAVGPGGEGRPFFLLVNDDTARVKETEPNDGFKQPMTVAGPVVVEASFKQAQDPDVYRIEGKAGGRIRIAVQARRYGSPASVLLALYDAGGRIVTTGESSADNPDPVLRATLPTAGFYFVSAIEASDQGGPMYAYRLVVRREP